jgi:hypothetical protein
MLTLPLSAVSNRRQEIGDRTMTGSALRRPFAPAGPFTLRRRLSGDKITSTDEPNIRRTRSIDKGQVREHMNLASEA